MLLPNLVFSQNIKMIMQDRHLLKVADQILSLQDVTYLERNLKGLECVFEDSLVVSFMSKEFSKDLSDFLQHFPQQDEAVKVFLKKNVNIMKKIRIIFKLLFYARNQSITIRPQMITIIKALVKENKCKTSILYKEGLKTNFSELMVLEVYFKSRYGAQLKKVGSFEGVQSSLQLFSDSLDKQYGHEYFW